MIEIGMGGSYANGQRFRFANFEFDSTALELRKGGTRIRLEVQPAQVLSMLLESQGQVVTRQELKDRLWADNTHVDFDDRVNQTISKIRRVLGDSSIHPHFVETLPRRGYRFIAAVDTAKLPAGPSPKQTDARPLAGNSAAQKLNATDDQEATEEPLSRYRVVEKRNETDEQRLYVAEDTKRQRSVEIRVVPQSSAERARRRDKRQRLLPWLIAGSTVVVAFAAMLRWGAPTHEPIVRRFTLPTKGIPIRPAISPNGRHIAYFSVVENQGTLWVQDLDQSQPRALVRDVYSDGPRIAWSPDSQFVGFSAPGVIRRVRVSGGLPVTVVESVASSRFTWTPDGESIIYGAGSRLYAVPVGGGEPQLWVEPEAGESRIAAPEHFGLDAGPRKLLYVRGDPAAKNRSTRIVALDRTSGLREVVAVGVNPVYDRSGHLIYERDHAGDSDSGAIWAVPFSVDTMNATGNPFPIDANGRDPSVSLDGTMVYLEGPLVSGREQLVWRDRAGNLLGTIGEPQEEIGYPDLSPDGRKVAVTGHENGNVDIWIHEVDRPVKTNFTTNMATDLVSIWSPSGDRIAFSSSREGDRTIYVKRTDGSGEPTAIVRNDKVRQWPSDWPVDGRIILFTRSALGTGGGDLWYLEHQEDGLYKETPLLQSPTRERVPQLSPDGRFVAYRSNRTGREEVFVCTFPECRDPRRVSLNGGSQPRWSKDGKELFYVEGNSLMAVSLTRGSALGFGAPEKLFSSDGLVFKTGRELNYDVTADGERFVLVEPVEGENEAPEPVIRIVQNWYEEFRNREQE